jgi:hypothetical protein
MNLSWELAWGIGLAVLAAVLFWAWLRTRKVPPEVDRAAEEEARRIYDRAPEDEKPRAR